ncbi:hypothetical protein K2173_014980 [Erythroxylum novogranatense]|uniref:Phosphatidylinositol 4-phosphate 5-kinase n=1 Tax=Erythroxylum novogranatense TaxID=1862640 RepID=A0AAV8TTR9_9ROSI|nr:hypothetical protein K2173_014980 [Erythroxylum novogranatense]
MNKEQSGVVKAWEATIRRTQAAKKRANSIFGTISVAHADDDNLVEIEPSPSEPYLCEKVMPNGDYYTGQWFDNFPHGQGKHLWADGCMYIGGWSRGKTNGRGRFSWPSGAIYEGDFKTGYMDGAGTYTGSNGETYKGNWIMNLKHGPGVKSFVNGDTYDGEWRRGLQEGQGKYQWSNGNHYIGEWRNGVISGKGSLVWNDGKRYDGYWEDGVPKGNGTLKWPDGSFYVGNWSRDPSERNGSYYPSGSLPSGNLEWDPQVVYDELSSELKIAVGEKISILPSQKRLAIWNSSKDGSEKPRRMSVDGRASVGVEKPFDRMNIWEAEDANVNRHGSESPDLFGLHDQRNVPKVIPMKVQTSVKKLGETICKGHKNYDLMLNLQLGIRHAVGRPGPAVSLDLKSSAFDPKEKYTPPHQSTEFKWKDYCPLVFRSLRKLFKVDAADYMLSICGNDALRELSSPGKSGSFFYLTHDDKYMIKTMKKAECKVFIRMLAAYYNHVRAFENTLVIKYFGLHCVKLNGPAQKKVRFIIMGNLMRSEYIIHRRFDLKGSSLGRTTDKPESEIDANTILKDLDLNFLFRLQKAWFQEFCRQVDRDCELLEQERIMDYSLLVGLHFRDVSPAGDLIPCVPETPPGETPDDGGPRLSRADMDQLLLDPAKWARIRLGVNMPGRVERTVRRSDCEFQIVGEPTGECFDVIMSFGIIDILQDYDISKKLEHAYKSIQYDPTSISAVDPKQYSRRFRDFIFKVLWRTRPEPDD